MLHIVWGRMRRELSAHVMEAIRLCACGEEDSRQLLIVPEHISHAAEVDLCRICGDTASRHAETLTFKLLSSRVMTVVGGIADFSLDNGGKLLTLQKCLQALAPILHVYRKPSRRAAFLENLLALMDEMQSYAVSPDTLSAAVAEMEGESGERLRDISLIYSMYIGELTNGKYDARDRLAKLEEKLDESAYAKGKDVFVDGFAYFTVREINILRILLRSARSVTVTLLTGDDRELFSESVQLGEQLRRIARECGCDCRETELPSAPPANAASFLSRYLLGNQEVWDGETDGIRICASSSSYHEVERVAAEIRRLVREEGYRYRDILVSARILADYEPLLETVFRRYDVPLYCGRRGDILQQPPLVLLFGALDSVTGGFAYEDIFRCLKTGLAGISPEECDLLENYVIKWDIQGDMWLHERDWTQHPEGYNLDWRDADTERLRVINALRARLREPLFHLASGIRGSGSAREKVAALYRYLEEIGLPEALQDRVALLHGAGETMRAEETAQLWNLLCGVMDQFVEILGEDTMDGEEFVRLLRLILTQYSVGTIPVSLDEVSCCETTHNDQRHIRALFILGVNDGVLPMSDHPGGVLRSEDRVMLEGCGIRLAPFGAAQFRLEVQNLHTTLAHPAERIYLSYPVSDGQGGQLRPSFVIGRALALFPTLRVETDDAQHMYRLSAPAPALACAGAYPGGALWQYFEEKEAYREQIAVMRRATGLKRGALSRACVHALYGKRLHFSASRLDKIKSCHFAYFMQYGLRAKERTVAGFDAPQIGTFVHDVMEHTLRAAKERGGVHALTRETLRELAQDSVSQYIARRLPDLSEKNARFRYLFHRLRDTVMRIVDEVAEELRVSDFAPMAFELSFGKDGDLPAVSIRTADASDDDELRVDGKIDRVDGWLRDGKLYLRVIDYKTGAKKFDLSELRYGLGIQLLLYLFVIERQGVEYFGQEVVPAGMLYTPAWQKLIRKNHAPSVEEIEKELLKTMQRQGILLNDPEVLQAMEHDILDKPCYLPISVRKNKEGEVQIGGSLATAEQLGKLSRYAEQLLRDMAMEIRQGNINADPYARSRTENACTYCEFYAACHFEEGRDNDHMEYIRSTGAEEFWGHIDSALQKRGDENDA